jgi:hypothetical protein
MTTEPRCESGTCIVHTVARGVHLLHNTKRPDTVIEADQAEWDTFVAGIEANYRARIVAALRGEAESAGINRHLQREGWLHTAANMVERDFADEQVS